MKKVTCRQLKLYQTDDGRRIQVFQKISQQNYYSKDQNGNLILQNFPQQAVIIKNPIYIGIMNLTTPAGMKEVKFQIEDANSISSAFDLYYLFAQKTIKKLSEQIKKTTIKDNTSDKKEAI